MTATPFNREGIKIKKPSVPKEHLKTNVRNFLDSIDPFAYLRDLLRRLPSYPHSRIGELLPNIWNKFNIQSA